MKFEGSSFQFALKYVAKGLPVLACDSVENRRNLNRRPFRNQVVLPAQATTDPATVAGWFLKSPLANIALPTGKASGIIAVCAKGSEGMRTLERWMDKYCWFPESSSVELGATRSIVYSAGHLRVAGELTLGPGVVALGDGQHVLLPPSQDDNGDYCTWDDPEDAVVEPPKWLVDLIARSSEVAA